MTSLFNFNKKNQVILLWSSTKVKYWSIFSNHEYTLYKVPIYTSIGITSKGVTILLFLIGKDILLCLANGQIVQSFILLLLLESKFMFEIFPNTLYGAWPSLSWPTAKSFPAVTMLDYTVANIVNWKSFSCNCILYNPSTTLQFPFTLPLWRSSMKRTSRQTLTKHLKSLFNFEIDRKIYWNFAMYNTFLTLLPSSKSEEPKHDTSI